MHNNLVGLGDQFLVLGPCQHGLDFAPERAGGGGSHHQTNPTFGQQGGKFGFIGIRL